MSETRLPPGVTIAGFFCTCEISFVYYVNMAIIQEIRSKVAADQFEFSEHAVDQSIIRHISVQELREAITTASIIEDYPDDKYGPSCLVLGFTREGRPIHVQVSYPARPLLKVITLYEPDPTRWINFNKRRKRYE